MSGSLFRMTGSGWLALPDVREWSRGYPECPGVVRSLSGNSGVVVRPSRMSGSGPESLSKVQEWSGGPPGCPGMIGMPYRMSGNCQEALPDVREWS